MRREGEGGRGGGRWEEGRENWGGGDEGEVEMGGLRDMEGWEEREVGELGREGERGGREGRREGGRQTDRQAETDRHRESKKKFFLQPSSYCSYT